MPAPQAFQREQTRSLLQSRGITRLCEFDEAGITAVTVSRLERDGAIVQLARALSQLADVDLAPTLDAVVAQLDVRLISVVRRLSSG